MKETIIHIMIFLVSLSYVYAGTVDEMMESCEKGSMNECYKAGMAYWKGEGVEKNKKVAISILKIACDGGVSDACNTLPVLDTGDTDSDSMKTLPSSIADTETETRNNYQLPENNYRKRRQNLKKVRRSLLRIGDIYNYYSNERFRFILAYPSDIFSTKILSENGDGITLYNADRSLELKAYGSRYGDNIKEIYLDELGWEKDGGQEATYRVLRRKWFVISGIDKKKHTIFYLKTYFKDGKSISFGFEYPIRDKMKYNSIISTVNNNFKIY